MLGEARARITGCGLHALVGDLDAELGNEKYFLARTRTSPEEPANEALAVSIEVTAE